MRWIGGLYKWSLVCWNVVLLVEPGVRWTSLSAEERRASIGSKRKELRWMSRVGGTRREARACYISRRQGTVKQGGKKTTGKLSSFPAQSSKATGNETKEATTTTTRCDLDLFLFLFREEIKRGWIFLCSQLKRFDEQGFF